MSVLDTVRAGVALANALTAPLQATVTHAVYQSIDGAGTIVFAAPVSRKALVNKKQTLLRSPSGELVRSQASLTFLDANVVIGPHDRITLPDGTTGPIITSDGFVDAVTGRPVMTEIYLG